MDCVIQEIVGWRFWTTMQAYIYYLQILHVQCSETIILHIKNETGFSFS